MSLPAVHAGRIDYNHALLAAQTGFIARKD